MDKKSVATSVLIFFMAIMFSIVGVCFSHFVFAKTKIEITSVAVKTVEGIEVFSDEKLTKAVNKLKLSKMELGIKPATGELDKETQIPSTITDEGTSEGYYSTVFVKTLGDYKIIVKNVVIESKKEENDVKKERENIFVAIKDVKETTKSLEKEETELVLFSNVEATQELTFMFWLGSLAGDDLEGAKISFILDFVKL